MFRNYFKTAWRSLWKSRFYSSLNILGLAIGLASGILILLWVQDELSFDGFHRRAPAHRPGTVRLLRWLLPERRKFRGWRTPSASWRSTSIRFIDIRSRN